MIVKIPVEGVYGQARADILVAVIAWLKENVGPKTGVERNYKEGEITTLAKGHKSVHIGEGWRYHKEWRWLDAPDGLAAQLLDIEEVEFELDSVAVQFKLAAPWEDALALWTK
jgi:hypothetical protein